jgi:hypothetical protein
VEVRKPMLLRILLNTTLRWKGHRPGVTLTEMTPFNFESIVNSEICVIVCFYFESRGDNIIWNVANVYESEKVTVNSLNCGKLKEFCDEMEIQRYPTMKMSKFGTWVTVDKKTSNRNNYWFRERWMWNRDGSEWFAERSIRNDRRRR